MSTEAPPSPPSPDPSAPSAPSAPNGARVDTQTSADAVSGGDAGTAIPFRSDLLLTPPTRSGRPQPPPPDPAVAPPNRFGTAATVITVIGVVAVLFAAFAMWGTAVLQQRDQDRLRSELTQRFVVDRASADTGAEADGTVIAGSEFGGGDEADAEDEADGPEQLGPAGPGDALALLRIPEIGVDQVVVAGTGVEQLRKGPGHLRGTSRPGERGNVVIAGKRSTYGSPFGDLDLLRKGDRIELATAAGTYRYKVAAVTTVEPEKDRDVVGPAEENQLTLFTANPRYQAAERLVVVAEFDDDQDGPPLVKVPPGFEPNSDELGLGRDSTAGAAVMLFGLLLALAGVGLVWARRHWTTWATWAVAAPVMVALGVLFFENLLRWFPSTV